MNLIGNLIIRCSSCGAVYNVDKDLLDKDVFFIGEFNMGARYQHEFFGEIECNCCGQFMVFKLLGFEYPVGAKEYQDSEIDGCEIIEEPYMEMEYELPEPMLSVFDQILSNPLSAYNLEPREFEELVAEVYMRNGFDTEITQKTRDGGRDVVATCKMGGVIYKTFFECKKYAPQRPVGVATVRELYAVLERDRIDKGVIVTTSYFTRDAIKEAEMFNGRIHLVDFKELLQQMGRQE